MKTLKYLLFIFFFVDTVSLYGQSKHKKSEDIILQFDYQEKTWNYKDVDSTNKSKPYFLIQYKSQPIIEIINLPSSSKVMIDEYFFDVTPEVEKKNILNGPSGPDKYVQTMAVVDSDEVSYKVTIKNSSDQELHTTTVFAKVYGKIKIDLSTGALFHNLQDESYFYSDAGSGQSSISKDGNKGHFKPLLPVVLTHFYWQGKGYSNFALSAGLGLDDSGKAGYYIGPGLILGDRQRIIVSAGWAFRPTDVLKDKYTVGQILNTSDLPENKDLVESIYKSGFFFSLTYNLTSKVEKR